MRLTLYTDYALRVLLYVGARPERLCSIAEIAGAYGISQSHLMKVVNDLARTGYLASVRGRAGGVRLGRPAEEINIGAVVRHTEDGLNLADCGSCVIAPACGLTGVLSQAMGAFLGVLDSYRLSDLLKDRGGMLALFAARAPVAETAPES